MGERVQTVQENKKGQDFAVGDIHGCFSLLEEALQSVQFDPEKDRLFSVGDLVNRGPESLRALEFLDKDWFYAVRGNHEEMVAHDIKRMQEYPITKALIRYFDFNGMGWILDLTKKQQNTVIQAFEKLPIVIQIPSSKGMVGVVHAEVPKDMDWDIFIKKIKKGKKKTLKRALWGRTRIRSRLRFGKTYDEKVGGIYRIFVGHTPQKRSVKRIGNCFYLDTGASLRMTQNRKKFHLTLVEITAKKKDITQKSGKHTQINVIKNI